MRRFITFLALLVTALATSVSLSSCKKPEPLRLGFVGGLTGRSADLGVAGRNGAMLAVEERNAAGGVKGRPVELVVRDDEQTPEAAKRVIAELIGQKTAVIVGPMTSSMAMAMVPIVDSSKSILISPTVTTNELTGKDDNFIRVSSPTSENAAKNARYHFEKLGYRRAAVIYDLNNKAYTESWLHDFSATFESLGGRVVKRIPFQSGKETIFSQMARELATAKPDIVVIISNAVDAAMVSQQLRKLDQQVGLDMAEWAATERLIELGGAAVEGAHVGQYFNRDDTSERFTLFVRKYRERFGLEPGFAGVAAYDAANVALDALAGVAPGSSPRAFILATGRFQGVQQSITFDRYGEAPRKTYVSVIKNGKFVTIE